MSFYIFTAAWLSSVSLLSNLPTGTFVASSGLESFVTHGYASTDTTISQTESVMRFLRHSVHSYAHLNVPFMSDAWQAMIDLRDGISTLEEVYDRITKIDQRYTSMTLNQVASRASTAQGVALLTLYEKALAKPGGEDLFSPIIQRMKVGIRQLTCEGHLSVCFGILTGAVGLGLGATRFLALSSKQSYSSDEAQMRPNTCSFSRMQGRSCRLQ